MLTFSHGARLAERLSSDEQRSGQGQQQKRGASAGVAQGHLGCSQVTCDKSKVADLAQAWSAKHAGGGSHV